MEGRVSAGSRERSRAVRAGMARLAIVGLATPSASEHADPFDSCWDPHGGADGTVHVRDRDDA